MVLDTKVSSGTLRRRLRHSSLAERYEEAVAFIKQFHRENALSEEAAALRIRSIRKEIKKYGFYRHTADEIAFGARIAWRNHARCIGRLHWRSLDVLDCRSFTSIESMAQRLIEHIHQAQGDGAIRSMISIFAPVENNRIPAFIESRQLIQYAGYRQSDHSVLGDPITLETTKILTSLGWRPPSRLGRFDLLPVLMRDAHGHRHYLELPQDLVRQVHIEHPTEPAIASLGLQWYALPCVSNLILSIGGIDYPCAPFNGYYMGTEIASRNFADERRYNVLPQIADAIFKGSRPELWKDHTLTVLNEAVLHSFRRDGLRIVDHHAASEQYMEFVRQEQRHGRHASGYWPWIVPPQAPAACPVFHLEMEERKELPNFYSHGSTDGRALRVHYDQEEHSRWWLRWKNIQRRYRQWKQLNQY